MLSLDSLSIFGKSGPPRGRYDDANVMTNALTMNSLVYVHDLNGYGGILFFFLNINYWNLWVPTAWEVLLLFDISDILHFLCCQRLISEHTFTKIWYLQQSVSLSGSGVKTNRAGWRTTQLTRLCSQSALMYCNIFIRSFSVDGLAEVQKVGS